MKKSIYIFLFALVLGACDDGFEEMNVNPTKPDQVSVKNKLTAAQLFASGGRYEAWRTNFIYSSTMIQHFATTAGYWSGDKYGWNKGYAAALLGGQLKGVVKSIVDMQLQFDTEESPEEMRAIVKILKVMVFQRLTDLYGDIPYSEAGKAVTEGILYPKYDKQSDIYADMLNELEQATAALGTGTSEFGDADIMFNGDLSQWKKFGNSLMLRLALRMVKVDDASAQAWAQKAISGGVMQSNADIAFIPHTDGPTGNNKNGNGEVFTVESSMRMSDTFIAFLQGDPRLPILAARRSDGSTAPADLVGLANGFDSVTLKAATGEENTDAYAEPNRNVLASEAAPMFFQTYAEVEFMLAEANVRWGLGTDAAAHYNDGVTAAMAYLEMYTPDAAIDPADISAYLTANPYDAANALEQINTQYWAATFMNEYESYANWRRTGFPVLTPVNYPGNETGGTIPRRLTYDTSEQSTNATNYAEALANQGPDVLTTRMWWDL